MDRKADSYIYYKKGAILRLALVRLEIVVQTGYQPRVVTHFVSLSLSLSLKAEPRMLYMLHRF